jgi:putative transposase
LALKKRRFSVAQIVGVLKQTEVGVPVAELIRKVGISEQTFYRWKKQHVSLAKTPSGSILLCFL